MKYEIIDTQAHIGPGGIEETLAAMNAIGIKKLIVDECWLENIMEWKPNVALKDGQIRHTNPTAQLAAAMYPDRFGYVLRINRLDKAMKNVIDLAKDDSACDGIRQTPGMNPLEWQPFAQGEYDELLECVEEAELVLFLHMPDHPEWVAACAKRHENLKIVIDHCGIFDNATRAVFKGLLKERTLEEQEEYYLNNVLKLAEIPNIYLKWSHYTEMFDEKPFPPSQRLSEILHKTIDAFGSKRIVWASDFSVMQRGDNWGELLYSLLGDGTLSDEEKRDILGENAKKLFESK